MVFFIFFVVGRFVPALVTGMMGYALIALLVTWLPAWSSEALFLLKIVLWGVYFVPIYVVANVLVGVFDQSSFFDGKTTYTFYWQRGMFWYPLIGTPLLAWEFWQTML